ncbi:MAG TPA: hypothetical protein VMT53_05020 [Terriglobales bacterium]|nr:hypothetical protein [Terriglobales bacterium]
MFITLLLVTFFISVAVSWVVVRMFDKPIEGILHRIVADEISQAWVKYLKFAIFVVGVSSGVRIWELEKYITPPQIKDSQIVALTRDRWVLEVYRTIIESLQGVAWLLLVFFVIALLAFVIVRVFELRKAKSAAA